MPGWDCLNVNYISDVCNNTGIKKYVECYAFTIRYYFVYPSVGKFHC